MKVAVCSFVRLFVCVFVCSSVRLHVASVGARCWYRCIIVAAAYAADVAARGVHAGVVDLVRVVAGVSV